MGYISLEDAEDIGNSLSKIEFCLYIKKCEEIMYNIYDRLNSLIS